MRLILVVSALLAASNSVSAFAPASTVVRRSALQSTVEAVSVDEIKSRMDANISKMSEKDAASKSLSKEVSYLKLKSLWVSSHMCHVEGGK